MNSTAQNKALIIALDFPSASIALDFIRQLNPEDCRLKVGFELYVAEGPDFVRRLVDLGFDVFLDLKFHDIPNTVSSACLAASKLGVWMMNVHALGGKKMLDATVNSIQSIENPPLLIAVTVLTSMDQAQLQGIGIQQSPQKTVIDLATMTQKSGLNGIVCSAQEAQLLRSSLGNDFLLITPGIRPNNSDIDDQSRVMTPKQAMDAGASYLVVGRPITQAKDPLKVITSINQDISHFKEMNISKVLLQ
ncbi:MAG TPA: orotidine-5'-phosphate decarboxylase [Thiotrichaceae bacterium]|nr:orotidine-5'-phosphate decarboxylase [Thiotrichaceae bacterium]